MREEFSALRQEQLLQSRALREEMAVYLDRFTQSLLTQLQQSNKDLQSSQEHFREGLERSLLSIADRNADAQRQLQEEQAKRFESLETSLSHSLADYRERMREQLSSFSQHQSELHRHLQEQQKQIRESLERSVNQLQQSNEQKLEEMRKTVDEKLENTLQTRLNQSFSIVSERLEFVHKGLGEMQQLAMGVGDLKRVLTNVKTRGTLGEMQLSNILQQLLAPEQYELNCITRPGTSFRVEFAIRIPQIQSEQAVLMPIDSKFPIEDYYSLLAAQEANDTLAAESTGTALEQAIRKSAKDIRDKYIEPPYTTDVGILFLPVEGLYAEATRRPALLESLQRDFQVIVAGPTTLSAILHTISFGYRTLALEKRSGEIRKTLAAVKTEFGKFGEALQKAQERIAKAGEDIDDLVGKRTRQINRQLKMLETLPDEEARRQLDSANDSGNEELPL
jgi:DNA recombination protein RmuC